MAYNTTNINTGDSDVARVLEHMSQTRDIKADYDARCDAIQAMYEEAFEVSDPVGARKLNTMTLFQAFWRMANRMKPHDYTLHGTGRPQEVEKVVTEGLFTFMDKGGFVRSLRDKNGLFQKLIMYGDGYMHVGTKQNSENPICFEPISNSNIYPDPYATSLRNSGDGQNATKLAIVFSYSKDQFNELYPDFADKGICGRIPRELGYEKELERTYTQTERLEDIVEVAHFYDIAHECYIVLAGAQCEVVKKIKGKAYPFVLHKDPYIPVVQFMCYPSSEGFYNYGIGNILYRLAVIQRQLLNMQIAHIEDNTYPNVLVNVPHGQAAKFFNQVELANQMRAAGKKPWIPLEYDSNRPGASAVSAQSIVTQNLYQEWQAVYEVLTRECRRLGVNLDDLDRGGNVTASQVLAEEENANAFVKQIMEYNASEMKFAVEVTMDFIKKFVPKSSKTILNLTTRIEVDEQEVGVDMVTAGALSDELKKNNYFVRINARSGVIPSSIAQVAQVSRLLSMTPPGSKAYYRLVSQFARLHDQDIGMNDLMPQAPGGQGGAQPSPEGALPSETDRIAPNPRSANQLLAI